MFLAQWHGPQNCKNWRRKLIDKNFIKKVRNDRQFVISLLFVINFAWGKVVEQQSSGK